MRELAQKEALGIVRKTYGSPSSPGPARPAFSNKSNVFTSTRARIWKRTYAHTRPRTTWCTMHRVYSSNNRGYIHFHPRFTHPHNSRNSDNALFFSLSSTSFLDIKAFNIERRIAMRPDSARGQSVLSGGGGGGVGNFGINSRRCANDAVSTNRRRRAPRLPFAVSRILPTSQWHSLVQYEQKPSDIRFFISYNWYTILWTGEHALNSSETIKIKYLYIARYNLRDYIIIL